jgi:C1A family cysteine protease
VTRKDGTPPCNIDQIKGFSKASVQGWGFISPHGVSAEGPHDVTRMVAALQKFGPAQIGIDASCVEGYTGGIITNCTSRNVDHAVAIVGADTDATTGVDYWLVRNSWNTTFGEDGYFRVQRDTAQMGIFGGYFDCYDKYCKVDP